MLQAGVVDQQVDVCGQGVHGVEIRQVARHGLDGGQDVGERPETGLVAVDRVHPGAVGHQPVGDRGADTGRGAGDQRGAAGEGRCGGAWVHDLGRYDGGARPCMCTRPRGSAGTM